MKWLVTAFEPFGGAPSNSSLIVLNRLKERDWQGLVKFFAPVPVRFDQAFASVRAELLKHPEVNGVLALGQAETRTRISLERVALNWIDARIADNAGVTPEQGPVEAGPDSLWAPIPWDRLGDSGHWERSYSAGTFVCNTLMYQLIKNSGKMAGFVHIPLLDSQTEPAFAKHPQRMAEETAVAALERILEFLSGLK